MKTQLKVFLVDDEQKCLDAIKLSLGAFNYVEIVGEVSNAQEAILFLQNNSVDLVFLDVEMKDINGFELAEHVLHHYQNIMIVFLTGHAGFALEAYEYRPVDYLVKPVNMLRLEETLSRALGLKNNKNEDIKVGIAVEGGFEIIKVNDILYIEKNGRKTLIVCDNGIKYHSVYSLQKMEDIFFAYKFFRSHQSFLIPTSKIKSIHPDVTKKSFLVQLDGLERPLPISREKYYELKELLQQRGVPFLK